MRIGVVWAPDSPGAHYRAVVPMRGLEGRGHEIVWPIDESGRTDVRRLRACDVVHVYRRHDEPTWRMLLELSAAGVALTYDNDDDFTAIPKDLPRYREVGGMGGRRLFPFMARVAKLAQVTTTTTRHLADVYARAGAKRVEVIPNQLDRDAFQRRERHDGVLIGWVAGGEHQVDARGLRIAAALREVVATCPDARVESVGLRLPLDERYRHEESLPLRQLREHTRRFDVGIAPLIDIPFNRARSDIKLKEYAACGVPWLASPVGPYVGLGPDQGGRLVADDAWARELLELVQSPRERRRLRRAARRWAKTQTIARTVDAWERALSDAAATARSSRTAAPATGSALAR